MSWRNLTWQLKPCLLCWWMFRRHVSSFAYCTCRYIIILYLFPVTKLCCTAELQTSHSCAWILATWKWRLCYSVHWSIWLPCSYRLSQFLIALKPHPDLDNSIIPNHSKPTSTSLSTFYMFCVSTLSCFCSQIILHPSLWMYCIKCCPWVSKSLRHCSSQHKATGNKYKGRLRSATSLTHLGSAYKAGHRQEISHERRRKMTWNARTRESSDSLFVQIGYVSTTFN